MTYGLNRGGEDMDARTVYKLILSKGGKAYHFQNQVLGHDSGGQLNDVSHDLVAQQECRDMIGSQGRLGGRSEEHETSHPSKISAVEGRLQTKGHDILFKLLHFRSLSSKLLPDKVRDPRSQPVVIVKKRSGRATLSSKVRHGFGESMAIRGENERLL
jgi:hypothetical protein